MERALLWVDSKQLKSSWVRKKRQIHRGNTVVGVCYMPPEPEKVD